MKNKIYKYLVNIGNVTAILLMITPIVILNFTNEIGQYWWLLLIFSICYDIYMYSIIHKNSEMEEHKEWFFNVKNDLLPGTKGQMEKFMTYEIICSSIMTSYFGNDVFKENLKNRNK